MKQKLTKTAALLFCCFKTCCLPSARDKNPFKVEDEKNILNLVRIFNYGRYTELNPNSKIGDNVVSQSTDIRRLRVQAMGMLTDKVFFQFS
jgi:hypothetical protein